jgi:hypothetical protein
MCYEEPAALLFKIDEEPPPVVFFVGLFKAEAATLP